MSQLQHLSDAELVGRTLGGDPDAYKELVGRYQGHVYGLTYSIVGNWAEAQDIAQETFIRAYGNLDQLRDRSKFAAWLRRIAFGVGMDWLKRYRPKLFEQLDGRVDLEHLEIPDFQPGPAEVAQKRELADAVLAALASLPPKYRVPLTMFHLDGLSYKKVADFLDIPIGTVKSMIHRAKEKLKGVLPPAVAKEMAPMVMEVFNEHRLPEEFPQEVLKRVGHWERFGALEGWPDSEEEKVRMVLDDPEWTRLMELELELEPLSSECRKIRKQIAHLERCHEHYTENVEMILEMIGSMKDGRIFDCLRACETRRKEAADFAIALQRWLDREPEPADTDVYTAEVFKLLGQKTEEKVTPIRHLVSKLRDNSYEVYADGQEDFDTIESRIQHLEICNFNWGENIRIVLREIAAGKRLFDWHGPDGYNAHGDCPDRVAELKELMGCAASWVEGKMKPAGKWAHVLGEPTPEKRWLVASLCKNISAQHKEYGAEERLAKPSV